MIATIALIASLLLGGTAGAGGYPDTWEYLVPSCWERSADGQHYQPCFPDVYIEKGYIEHRHLKWMDAAQDVATHDAKSCLAKMEAAMKAMEETWKPITYFAWVSSRPPTTDSERKAKAEQDKLDKAREVKRDAAYQLWESTKRECWRTP